DAGARRTVRPSDSGTICGWDAQGDASVGSGQADRFATVRRVDRGAIAREVRRVGAAAAGAVGRFLRRAGGVGGAALRRLLAACRAACRATRLEGTAAASRADRSGACYVAGFAD